MSCPSFVSVGVSLGSSISSNARSSMPSIILEHDAQIFGLREREFPWSAIDSPQQIHIRGLIRSLNLSLRAVGPSLSHAHPSATAIVYSCDEHRIKEQPRKAFLFTRAMGAVRGGLIVGR